MERHDVTLEFEPTDALSVNEQQAWSEIVAKALKDMPGGLTATFVQEEGVWVLRALTWGLATREAFRVAYDEEVASWRASLIDALLRAGKRVRLGA